MGDHGLNQLERKMIIDWTVIYIIVAVMLGTINIWIELPPEVWYTVGLLYGGGVVIYLLGRLADGRWYV